MGVVRDRSKTEVPYKDKLLPWVVKGGEKIIKFDDQINWIAVERQAAVPGGQLDQSADGRMRQKGRKEIEEQNL